MTEPKSESEVPHSSSGRPVPASRLPAARGLSDFIETAPSILPDDKQNSENAGMPASEYQKTEIDRADEIGRPSRPAIQGWPTLAGMPPFPRRRQRSRGAFVSFMICVVLPVLIAVTYYAKFASSQYVSEFKFTVNDTTPNQGATASQGASALLGLLGAGGGNSVNQNYIVVDYLMSRQAVEELEKRIKVISLYSRDTVDPWARFNALLPFERFVLYWQRTNVAQYDPITGIADVQVRAFSAEDAQLIAKTMVTLAEELINRINTRMHSDAVKFAQSEVARGEARVKDIRDKLTEFRNRTGVIDPNASLVASNSQLAQTLRANIAQLETQLRSFTDQKLSPDAPIAMTLRAQINAAKQQLESLESSVAKTAKGAPLSSAVAQFEQLDLERQFAQNMLTSAQQSLDQARAIAAAQFLYIEPYVQPSLPTSPTYPRPFVIIPLVALFAFVAWNLLRIAARSIRDHYI